MFKKLPLALMMGILLSASNAFALGVGDIKVNSALNQRLNAEIELISSVEGELDDVNVRLASTSSFNKIKLNRPYHLTAIKFTITTRSDGTPIIRLTTDKSIREPFLDFLIDVSWPKGRMLREYTVLLDPPVTMAAAPAKTVSEPAVQPMVEEAATEEPVVTPLEPMEPVISEPVAYEESGTYDTGQTDELGFPIYSSSPGETYDTGRTDELGFPIYSSSPGETYGPVAANETLWSIASRIRSESASTQQMMLALYEANPDAFANGDIHSVKRGAVLRIPDEAAQISRAQADALAEVRQLNASIGISPDVTAETTREQPGLPDVSEPVFIPESETIDESKLSLIEPDDASVKSAGATSSDTVALRRELSLARGSLTSQRMKNQELSSRVRELEGTVAEMGKLKRLLELQSQEMAQLQRQLAEAEGTVVSEAETPPQPMAEPEAVQEEQPVAEVEAEAVAEAPDAGTGSDVTTYAVEEEAIAEEPATPEESVEPLPPPVKKGAMDIVMDLINTAMRDPMALIGKLQKDPMLMGIVGGVFVVLIALIVLIFRRKGGTAEPVEAPAIEEKAASVGLGEKIKGIFKKKPKADAVEEEPEIDLSDMFQDEEDAETDIHAAADEEASDKTILEAPPDPGAAKAVADMDFEEDASAMEEAPVEEEPVPEGPDPLEEVDVYEAFGDFDQAAEIVKSALKDDPDNNDFKLRLFAVYSGGEMADEFATTAVQYQSGMEGSSQWDEVVAMGKQIAPDCPAWGDSASSPALPASDAGDMANTVAMDISALQSLDAAPADEPTPAEPSDSIDESDMDFALDIGADEAGAGEDDATVADVGAEPDSAAEEPMADQTPVSPSVALEDSNELEFDLGELDIESAEEPAADVTEEAESLDVDNSLDFGMDETAVMDDSAAAAPAETVSEENELEFDLGDVSLDISEETPSIDVEPDDSGLALETDDSPAAEDSVSEGLDMVSETVQVKVDAAEQIEASVSDEPSEDPTVMLAGEPAEEPDDADEAVDTSLGVDLSDFSFDMDESGKEEALDGSEEAEPGAEEASLDEISLGFDEGDSGDGLELGADDSVDEGLDELALSLDDADVGNEDPTVFLAEDSDDSGSLSAEGDEVSTKLDLARAYIDMGDSEGAKGILEEVIAEGNDEQKAEAAQLLQQAG